MPLLNSIFYYHQQFIESWVTIQKYHNYHYGEILGINFSFAYPHFENWSRLCLNFFLFLLLFVKILVSLSCLNLCYLEVSIMSPCIQFQKSNLLLDPPLCFLSFTTQQCNKLATPFDFSELRWFINARIWRNNTRW